MPTCNTGATTTEVEVATDVVALRRSLSAGAIGVFVRFDWAAYALPAASRGRARPGRREGVRPGPRAPLDAAA
jgi:hypothetical protein